MNAATSAGIKLRRFGGQEVLTVSHHGFLVSKEVYHPYAGEDKIGDIIDTRPLPWCRSPYDVDMAVGTSNQINKTGSVSVIQLLRSNYN